ncbi:precursor to secretory protein Ssp120 [Amanita rubescens]|nr:precursor to secretory protein Ssp120 [Amanita rubescens]
MRVIASLPLLVLANFASGHGDHGHGGPADGEAMQDYARRHMASEHHIDTFDVRSFFKLHDLRGNGFLDNDDIEFMYGIRHVYARALSKDEEEQNRKGDIIVQEVLKIFDLNNDGKISPGELETVGLDKLPNFDNLGAEGHHYDVESEFFLHHEEKYHNTPETQTDESYIHPEDIEHFSHHEKIERVEAERLAQFQGISVEEVLKYQNKPDPGQDACRFSTECAFIRVGYDLLIDPIQPPKPKITRVTPPEKQEPSVKFKDAEAAAKNKDDWGAGNGGYVAPREPSDRLRKNLPYKYKFRRNWGDF